MISILIPAYNETERIGATISAALRISVEESIEIVVVDDGSQDDTAKRAEAAGADVVIRQTNQGKGGALNTALKHANGEILLLLDADLGDTASEGEKLLRPILDGMAEMTIATFPVIPGKGGGMGLAVKLARWGIRRYTGQIMMAPLSGQRAMRREVVAAEGFATGWGVEIALTFNALRDGNRVLEIPTVMSHRVTGRKLKDILHRASQFRAVALTLLHLRHRRSTLKANL